MNELTVQKTAVRKSFLARRRALGDEYRERASRKMLDVLFSLPEFLRADCVFAYASMPDEVNLDALLKKCLELKKRIALPRVTGKHTMEAVELRSFSDLVAGKYGIRTVANGERIPKEALDLIVVPGVAFTEAGFRLGMGGGFYDTFLNSFKGDTVALAFDVQLADELPLEAHDARVERIITESRCWRTIK